MGAKRDFITSRRITAVILSMLILTACFIISAVSVSAADDTSSAGYVKSVAKAVNARKDTPDMFYAGDAYEFDLTKESLSRTFFAFRDFKAEDVEGHPELVDYSCKIPGVATASYCTAFDACFIKLPKYSEWVEVEGTLRIIILDDGTRKIDISGCDNAAENRDKLKKRLNLPQKLTPNSLLAVLNCLMTRNELIQIMGEEEGGK